MRALPALLSTLLLAAGAPVAWAEVVSVGDAGFSIRLSTTVETSAEETWNEMVGQLARWWNKDHTWSGDAGNLSIDARAGGCFCERLADGGSVEHLRVVFAAPGRMIRMQGGLGPLQEMGLQGAMTWSLSAADNATQVDWAYVVHGYLEGGFNAIAPAVDAVLAEQLASLASRLQTY